MRLAEMIRSPATAMDEQHIRENIRLCLGIRRHVFGKVGNVTLSMGIERNEQFFVFAEQRTAYGFAILQEATIGELQGHYVNEIGLLDPMRWQGTGLGFYHLLLDHGYTLFSGAMQTQDSERVWRKLLNDPTVIVEMIDLNDLSTPLDPQAVDPWSKDDYRLIARQ